MKINDFFIEKSLELNWEFILNLPHFKEMENTQQNPRWHSEGNCLKHVQLTCEHAIRYMEENTDRSLHNKRLFILAALFHDVGKPKTTFVGKDGNFHSYGHEDVGSKIVRQMLWDWPIYEREYIAHMVKWHMSPLFFKKSNNPEDMVNKITKVLPYKDIYALKMADLEGALQDPEFSTKEQDRGILNEFLEIAERLNRIPNLSMLKAFPSRENPELNNWVGCSGDMPYYGKDEAVVHVMIGLPGSGKNTYLDYMIEKNPEKEFIILSRDDIRVELGYCTADEKIVGTDAQEKKVTQIFNERFLSAVNEKKEIIINNINLSKKRRKALKSFLGKRKVTWCYWYIEAPTFQDNIERRKGQISESVFHNMVQNFDFPEPEEYTNFTVVKQIKNRK